MVRKLLILCSVLLIGNMSVLAQTPVEKYGKLTVNGNRIVGENGDTVQLRGMSMGWSQWEASRYYTRGTVNWLVSDWKITVIRAALGIRDSLDLPNGEGMLDGYLVDSARQKARIDTVVQAAISNGIYVIVDWHDHNANMHVDRAKAFFSEMAAAYKDVPNIIWEIWNEPNNVGGAPDSANDTTLHKDTWDDILGYANEIIPAIRASSSNLIVVGTPNWSQDVDTAANRPILDQSNIAYTLHFYAGTHKSYLRNKATAALNKGVALFVTEWGNCASSGDGAIDLQSTKTWLQFLDDNRLSSCNWNINYKAETSSALKSLAAASGNWKETHLTASGTLMRAILRGYDGVEPFDSSLYAIKFDTLTVPGRVEAEKFSSSGEIQSESTGDVDGVDNIGWIDDGDWAEYTVNVTEAGTYSFDIRVASDSAGGELSFSVDSVKQGTVTVPSTGDWQEWTTVSSPTQITFATTGIHKLRLDFNGAGTNGLFNVNWVNIYTPQAVKHLKFSKVPNVTISRNRNGMLVNVPKSLGMKTMEIFGADGKLIHRSDIASDHLQVTNSNLKRGLYIFRFSGAKSISRSVIFTE